MYTINDKQINYILSDIRARGVEMEDLQNNLLDHICCIIEQNLEENGDFEDFYKKTIPTFYKDDLWEIEEETLQLLTFKHYYTMKKIMLNSGIFSAAALVIGLILKFLHLPGASIMLVLGVGVASLFFLPLVFTLKAKEKQRTQEKITLIIGGICCSVISLSILFKVQHWPFANVMLILAMLTLLLVFVPVYLINGVRNPETKVNTITSSMMIVLGCGLMFILYRSPKNTEMYNTFFTQLAANNEELLANEWKMSSNPSNDSSGVQKSFTQIYEACTSLKVQLFKMELGVDKLDANFEKDHLKLEERSLSITKELQQEIENITNLIKEHNEKYKSNFLPVKYTLFDTNSEAAYTFTSLNAILNQITQVQWFALQNKTLLLADR